ncbi:hypothetical protein PC116_g23793 [Phytophthora cactorum]|nr:hypothetical protein Pcac1_g19550 [Phytophthora cactorum]KAG3142764.1 hypothetical protein C6341_g19308 [Phytophthora cactorum]KAG4227833.1 hypothetical protein PC116_g23793 [Phytophthora cactorum]
MARRRMMGTNTRTRKREFVFAQQVIQCELGKPKQQIKSKKGSTAMVMLVCVSSGGSFITRHLTSI